VGLCDHLTNHFKWTIRPEAARRLAPDTKDLLQTLSVIGREFPISLIRAVVPKSDDGLDRMLGDLQWGEFIYEEPAVGDTQYTRRNRDRP
jgi:hypothetical protein